MSTDPDEAEFFAPGVPELTHLGKRIELLRLERRMSKRILAQRAGTSRQQLWRVMTGKSDLTTSLCTRLADVLETDSRSLRELPAVGAMREVAEPSVTSRNGETLEEYVANPNGLERTLATIPGSNEGRRLKRVLLDAIEEIAMARAAKLPQIVFDLRRAVVNADDTGA